MQTKENRIKVLGETPVLKAILIMAIPVILGMLVQVFYNMVDTYFIGMMNDVNQLAAANLGFPFFMIMMATAGVIGIGSASVISRYIGMKKMKEAGEIVSLSFFLVALSALVVTALTLCFLDRILPIIGARGDIVGPTKDYLLPLVIGSVIIMGNYSLGITLRAEGAAIDTTIGMVIGSVVNIILDPIMIFPCGWGIAGAAWATVIGNLAGLLWYLRCYARKSILRLSFSRHLWNREYFRGIFSIGIPSGINQALISVSNMIANNLAASYGAAVLGAMGVAGKVNSIAILVLLGLATGCQPLFGYNYGARNRKRLVSLVKTTMLLSFIFGSFMLVAYTLIGKQLIAVFTDIPEVVSTGAYILTAMSCAAPLVGICMTVMNCLQAIGKSIPALILSTGRQGFYYIPCIFILNALFGFNGFIFTQAIVDVLMVVTATLTIRHVIRTDPLLRGPENAPENGSGRPETGKPD